MAKKAKAEPGTFRDVNEKQKAKEAEGHGVAAIRGNGYSAEATTGFIERLENLDGERETAHMEYMQVCKRIAEDRNEVLNEAKDAGFKKKTLKAAVKKRALERKIENIRADMEQEDADDYDQVLQALGELGDTPLGAAALSKASGAPNGAAASA